MTGAKLDSVQVEVEGVPFTAVFEYWPEHRGARDSLGGKPGAGPPLEPDEPADLEIVAVYVEGHDLMPHLNDEALLKISKALMEVER